MSEAEPDAEFMFELTVDGELGPVLRHALQPGVAERQTCTIFRATADAGSGVAEFVRMLDAEGLTVESIHVSGASTRHVSAPAGVTEQR